MATFNFVTFVVLKILENLVSMKNSLNANNYIPKQTAQADRTFISNIRSESSIHFSTVLDKRNVFNFS